MNLAGEAAMVVAAYLIGSIPVGYILGRVMRGIDIREHGSGVIGATNVLRLFGKGPFILVMVLDAVKGYVPTMIAWAIFGTHDMQVAAGIAAVLGHDFPVFIGFRGGRGVAVSFGVYAALAMPLFVGMVALGIFIVLALRYMSVMSMITVPGGAAVLLALAVVNVDDDFTYSKAIFGLFATLFVLLTHIPNIKRLIRGTEPKIGESEQRPAEAGARST
jgi:glycerol-3-phosphate acyltransferase PlsY